MNPLSWDILCRLLIRFLRSLFLSFVPIDLLYLNILSADVHSVHLLLQEWSSSSPVAYLFHSCASTAVALPYWKQQKKDSLNAGYPSPKLAHHPLMADTGTSALVPTSTYYSLSKTATNFTPVLLLFLFHNVQQCAKALTKNILDFVDTKP